MRTPHIVPLTRTAGDEEEDSGEEGVLAQFVSGQDDIEHIDETHRLAVVDLEWDRIRAVDLLAVRLRGRLAPVRQCGVSSFAAALTRFAFARPGAAFLPALWRQDRASDGVPFRLWAGADAGGGSARAARRLR